ncbi:TPA: hypothetical protein DCQ22_04000 [Candidatus Nomurabacteria bacterium]|nr:hypothetical protein [Candidatus Nomurabacteria bacterium]
MVSYFIFFYERINMAEISNEKFPSNSHISKLAISEDGSVPAKNIQKIANGRVIQKRKSIGNTITQTLFGNDARAVVRYILQDVLIPAAKSTIQEMVSGGIEMLLFGESGGRNRSLSRDRNRSYVSYNNFSKSRSINSDRFSSRSEQPVHSLRQSKYENIVLEDRGEAEDVIENLCDLIDQYGVATLSDFFELVDVDSDFSDNKYGWTNLSQARVNHVREGYVIAFPKARPVE